MQPTIQQAWEAHRAVRKALYYSPEPPVWWNRRPPRPLPFTSDTLLSFDRAHSQIERYNTAGFSNIGVVTQALLANGLAMGESDLAVTDYDTLLRSLEHGQIARGIPNSDTPLLMEDAVATAQRLGYEVPALPARAHEYNTAEANVLAACVYLARRRFAPGMLFLTTRFIVANPLVTKKKVAHFIDIFWMVRDTRRPGGLRFLAVQVGGIVNDACDRELANVGIEVLHIVCDWARIDPQRCVFEQFRLAGIGTLRHLEKQSVGNTINDYHCAYCREPMIRSWTGEGIAFHRNRAVHEQCFNGAVNEGFPDDVA